MQFGIHKSRGSGLRLAGIAAALFVLPVASRAQFGNVAYGFDALANNTSGCHNSAFGYYALYNTTTGSYNSANGFSVLFSNTAGNDNVVNGYLALYSNTTGSDNVANGYEVLYSDTTGITNVANGSQALYSNTTGSNNVANGAYTLYSATTGDANTVDGAYAGYYMNNGSDNIFVGYEAGSNVGSGGSTTNNNIEIGNVGTATDNGVIYIGTQGTQTAAYMAGIYGAPSAGKGLAVLVDQNGQLYTKKSSRRFKTDIHDMSTVSDKLMKLRPVTFRYKQAAKDGTHPVEYGLIAEEVAKVFPDLVEYDKAGKPYAVDYDALTPMLLNELQKEHRASVSLQAKIAAQGAELASVKSAQKSEITALKTQLASLQHSLQVLAASRNTTQTKPAVYTRQ